MSSVAEPVEKETGHEEIALHYIVTKILSEHSSLKEVSKAILEAVTNHLSCVTGCLWIIDRDGNNLKTLDFWSCPESPVKEFEDICKKTMFQPGIGLPGRAYSTKQYSWIPNISYESVYYRGAAAESSKLVGGIAFPIKHKDSVLGILEFFKCDSSKPDDKTIALIESICNQLGTYIKNKEAEEEQKKLLSLIDSTNDSIIVMTLEGVITNWNTGAERLFGYKPDEIKGKHISIIIPDNFLADALKLIERTKKGERIDQYETQRLKKDKTLVDVSLTVSPVYQEGEIVAISSISRNITAEKNIKEQLLESESRFRFIIQQAPDAIITANEDQIITNWNTRCEAMFGWTKEEVIGKKLSTVIPLRYKEKFEKEHQAFIDGAESSLNKTANLILIKKDNSEFQVELNAAPIRVGQKHTCIAFLRDITERKKAEEKIKRSERNLKEAQKISKLGSWEWGVKDHKIEWSDELYRIFGYKNTKSAISINSYFEHIHPDDQTRIKRILDKALQNKTSFVFEHRILDENGELKYLACKGKVISDIKGQPVKMIGTAHDISERKRAEIQLEKYAEELKLIAAQKDKFFSIVAHDLRTPFQGLLGFSEIITKNFDNLKHEDIKDYVSRINAGAKNLLNLMNNLLDWSVLQTGKIKFNPEKVNMRYLVSDIIKILSPNAANKKIKIECEIPKDVIVQADITMLRSSIQNLLSNALKFSYENSNILLSCKEYDKDFYRFSVKDNGVGIKQEDLQKLFQINLKHSTSGTNEEKGTGLGLILVKDQIEKNGGKIWVESSSNNGSTFHFIIPKYKEAL